MLETELAFVEQLVKDIETDALEGIDLWRALYRPDGTLDPDVVAGHCRAVRRSPRLDPTEPEGRER